MINVLVCVPGVQLRSKDCGSLPALDEALPLHHKRTIALIQHSI